MREQRLKGKHGLWYAMTVFCGRRLLFKFNLISQLSSSSTKESTTMRAPPSAQRPPSLSPISESFHPSEFRHTTAMLIDLERPSIEEVGASMSAGPSQGSAQEDTPLEIPLHRQALRGESVEQPSPNGCTPSIVALRGSNKKPGVLCCDQQGQSEQEVAEQR